MCLILGSLEAFTLYVLSKFAERYQAPSYGKLIRKALGRKLGACESLPPSVFPLRGGSQGPNKDGLCPGVPHPPQGLVRTRVGSRSLVYGRARGRGLCVCDCVHVGLVCVCGKR